MPKTLRSYFITALSKVGLFDPKAAKLGLRRLYADDVFIVSFPKSGNTWVRFLIANMLEDQESITMKNINRFVPGIYNFRKEIDQLKENRRIKSHDAYFSCYPKTVYVYRDFRDVVVSYYYYMKGLDLFEGSLAEFVRSEHLNTNFGTWENHVAAALDYREKHPENILFVGFHELKKEPEMTLQAIANFCGIVPKRSVPEIIELCDFENLKTIETTHGKVFNQSKVNFFRSGELGQWSKELSEADLELVLTDQVCARMEQLNIAL